MAVALAWIAASVFYAAVHLAWGPPHFSATAFVFAAAVATALVLSHAAPATDKEVARLIDRRLDLKDRLATALEYQGAESGVALWLMEDAEQKARFVEASKVVPLPPRPSARGKLLALALAAASSLWFIPLPAGVFSAAEELVPYGEASGVTEDEIFDRASRLLEEVRSVQSPQLQRIQRDIAQLQAGLRDRSLPRDDALALLQLLERRARSALEALRAGVGPPSGEADLDRLQDLASRLVAAATAARSGDTEAARETIRQLRQLNASALRQNPELERLLSRLEESDPLQLSDELLDAASRLGEAAGGTPGEPSRPAQGEGETGAGTEPAPGEIAAGDELSQGLQAGSSDAAGGSAGGETDPAEGSGAGDGAIDEANGSPSGSGAQPGAGPGGDAAGEFVSAANLRELYYLPGEILDGPIRSGTVQSNLFLAQEGQELARVATLAPAASIDAAAVEREPIPLAYRDTVKRYFQSLEPSGE